MTTHELYYGGDGVSTTAPKALAMVQYKRTAPAERREFPAKRRVRLRKNSKHRRATSKPAPAEY